MRPENGGREEVHSCKMGCNQALGVWEGMSMLSVRGKDGREKFGVLA